MCNIIWWPIVLCALYFLALKECEIAGGLVARWWPHFFLQNTIGNWWQTFQLQYGQMAMLAEFESLKITDLFLSSLEPRVWTATSRSARWTAATWPSCSPSRWSGSPTRASPPTSSGKQQAPALLNTWTFWALLVQQSLGLQVQYMK